MERYYLGVDDTDVPDSRGTGFLARSLAGELLEAGLARPLGITRHQLLVDPRIPYTSHNSSACLALAIADVAPGSIARAAGDFLELRAAPGADPGLCLAPVGGVGAGIVAFGGRAKREVVPRHDAELLAREAGVHLSAHGGSGLGVIGALAAVGLRAGGGDGRFLELGELRHMRGEVRVGALRASGVARFQRDGVAVDPADDEIVRVGDWCRPVLRDGVAVLLLTEVNDGSGVRWGCAPRDLVRSY